ncbi:acetyl-CoA acetyltransferase [Arsenicicoccus dermatophilus]|uniref:acetyl-CoA acetyltransferase n=1 Tax=Arsenicicoccus dermatophilus TaxID=1076331 RepID=UPI001F4D1F34|nr:acetyl-CoA acetyltransferase [Arsenicicoccus dermatophilus]MCH8613384.1 acetyl-CoA acetyltransferase [Arsenicicoccus dermatophilus]
MRLDPRTPVVVGVGECGERLADPAYAALPPAELAARAVAAALVDAAPRVGLGTLRRAVDVVADIPQFAVSTPDALAPLGHPDNMPRAVASRAGLVPRLAITDVAGGQGPQHLVTELMGMVARGECDMAVACGAEALSTTRHLLSRPPVERPSWSESVGGHREWRGYGLEGLVDFDDAGHIDAPSTYALFERARQRRLERETGLPAGEYDRTMAELFAPLSHVAATHPHAALREAFTPEQLLAISDRNRLVAQPYRKLLVARDLVNQGAAVLVTSVGRAASLGVPQDRWVSLHGHCDTVERPLLERPDLGAYPAAVAAIGSALGLAGVGLDEVRHLDLYSCFPIAVSAVCDGLGLAADDPRGLTLTGGLPYFGGPGNDYTMHAIAAAVRRLRETPGELALTTGNGGVLSKYSVGVWGTVPRPWRPGQSAAVQAALDAAPRELPPAPAGPETWTITHGRDGARRATVVERDEDGRRTLRHTTDQHEVAALA